MTKITNAKIFDLRFPTSKTQDGSDAMYQDPDYSAAYLILETDHPKGHEGQSLIFSIGRGNELCVAAIRNYFHCVLDEEVEFFFRDMGAFAKSVTSDSQLRWLGPEKGIVYMAAGAIINAVWDLYAKMEDKPLWKLLADMSPEELVSCIDFSYITDAILPTEAVKLLENKSLGKEERINYLKVHGHPAYTTSVGWMGYSDDKIKGLCSQAVSEGWTAFKMKVGGDLQDDIRRARLIREVIGPAGYLMMDANEVWDVNEAVDWMRQLALYQPFWIEEPTNPDDVLGHQKIKAALSPIKIATGEVGQNRVLFKQFFQTGAIDICQVDAVRMAGVNEVLAVLLLALKYDVPVCPHGGGVGLCELAQHIGMLDFIVFAGNMENRMIEYVDHLHEHFVYPVKIDNGHYKLPESAGYSVEIKRQTLIDYTYQSK